MPASHWLVKSEPGTYSWDDLVRDRTTRWDGVRNAQARNNLSAMRAGDLALFYHSGERKRPKGARSEAEPSEVRTGRQIVGVAEVVKAAYPDPTSDDARWLVVDLAPVAPLREPVSLAVVKADSALASIALVRQGRLSVMPIEARAFARILTLGKTKLPGARRPTSSADAQRGEAERRPEPERERSASAKARQK